MNLKLPCHNFFYIIIEQHVVVVQQQQQQQQHTSAAVPQMTQAEYARISFQMPIASGAVNLRFGFNFVIVDICPAQKNAAFAISDVNILIIG